MVSHSEKGGLEHERWFLTARREVLSFSHSEEGRLELEGEFLAAKKGP